MTTARKLKAIADASDAYAKNFTVTMLNEVLGFRINRYEVADRTTGHKVIVSSLSATEALYRGSEKLAAGAR